MAFDITIPSSWVVPLLYIYFLPGISLIGCPNIKLSKSLTKLGKGKCYQFAKNHTIQDKTNLRINKIGFLLNTNTTLQNFLIHGCWTNHCQYSYYSGGDCGGNDYGGDIAQYYNSGIYDCHDGGGGANGLSGGGIFELPGCIGNRPIELSLIHI